MRVRINDIPSDQHASWAAVLAILRADNRTGWKMHWTAEHPAEGKPFTVVDFEVPGEDMDALRAEIGEAIDIVNEIARQDPLGAMTPADIGLTEVFLR
jgi:hypothetical protein